MARKRRSDPLSEGLSSARPTPKRIEVIEQPVEVVAIVDNAMVRKSLKRSIFFNGLFCFTRLLYMYMYGLFVCWFIMLMINISDYLILL